MFKIFNYANLNDVEFENLCKDIMEKQLSTSLRLFAKGRDGGIDFTDSTITHNIIVQAKHYIGSKFSDLRTTLKKEIDNVNKLKPNQYYLCCGMQLTDANVKEIFDMFSAFMRTDKNIITLREIDEFLQKPENTDVVRKNYKLWLYATNILQEIYNQNTFIDCESLLSDIDEESKYFVQTNIYEQCIDHLDNNGLLMITGGPGVGKTTTSKMLVLYYAAQGFRVRYTTNGDITDIKKSLSHEKECKEIVLLDDCLGQHYFNMKHTQENELLSLIKYVKLSKNKKIILNSRITIFNEAKERSRDFNIFFQEKKIKNYTIDMNNISLIEKAEIFYNHLIYKCIPKEYYNNIKENKNYLKIVQHNNYTPRIIEHVTYEYNYSKVTPELYFKYIMENLIEPNNIWKDEFERRLQDLDRAFLSTLYSLTDTNIDYEVLKKCFESRLYNMKDIDSTIDNCELIVYRLNQSIINIVDNKGGKHIGVINPSVNDYLKSIFFHNNLELQEVRKSICHFKQFERCYKKEELDNVYLSLINNHKANGLDFLTEKQKIYFIVAHVCKFNIKDAFYQQAILNYLCDAYFYYPIQNDWLSHAEIFSLLLNGELYSYYSIIDFILDEDYVSTLLLNLNLEELVFTVKLLNECYKNNNLEVLWFKLVCNNMLNDAIIDHVENIDAAEYCDNYNVGTLIEQNSGYDEDGDFDRQAIINKLKSCVVENIEQEIQEHLLDLDSDIYSNTMLSITDYVSTEGIDNYIDSYFEPDYDDEHGGRGRSSSDGLSEIEAIFER